MSKVCPKCGEKNNSSSSYCHPCHNDYQKKWHKNNPKSINESALRRKVEVREFIKKAKTRPCVDCGKSYHWYVMDCDHVRGIKKFNLSTAVNKPRSLKSVKEELEKCEIVCANCHRERTFARL